MSEQSETPEITAADRFAKAEAMRAAGIEPYPGAVERTHSLAEANSQRDALLANGQEITLCGRCGPIRMMGKAAFFHVSDATGRIQVYMKKNILGDEAWQQFVDYLEFCDFVQVTGPLFLTKTGELTLEVRRWRMLTKTIRHLPKEHFGLRDHETRVRRRHVDLAVNPESRALFLTRAKIISAMRRWLEERGYTEVESPVMHAIPGGAMARPFITHHNALGLDLYLRIALELHHKRCVVGGIERVFEIGRIFRNEGISTRHNPEFTMMELYTAFVDVTYTEDLTESLIRHLAQDVIGNTSLPWGEQTIDVAPRFRRVPLCAMLSDACGQTIHPSLDVAEIRNRLGAIAPPKHEGEGARPEEPGHVILGAFEHHFEHTLIQPTFVTDFPKSVSPLAKAKPGDPLLAERSELYLGGLEVAPMYTELNDPAEQRRRFEDQMRAREAGDEEAMRMDIDFLDALEHGMPPTSGMGLGVDRLVMLLTNQQSIRDVILFPLLRPEFPEKGD